VAARDGVDCLGLLSHRCKPRTVVDQEKVVSQFRADDATQRIYLSPFTLPRTPLNAAFHDNAGCIQIDNDQKMRWQPSFVL
jgi:hypothetical protein